MADKKKGEGTVRGKVQARRPVRDGSDVTRDIMALRRPNDPDPKREENERLE